MTPAIGPRRLHPASPFLDLSGLARQLLAPGVVALSAGGLRLLALGIVVVLAVQVLAWRRRTFDVADGVLRIDAGLIVRSQQALPCERIQQVNLVQKLRHRALGVAVLDVEGAGRESGARLEVLELGEAQRLRDELLAAKATAVEKHSGTQNVGVAPMAGEGAGWVPTPWPVVELSYRQLAVAGLTGIELLVIVTLLAPVFQFVEEPPWSWVDGLDVTLGGVLGPLVAVVVVLGVVAVWLGLAVAASILADGGYRLSLFGEELRVQRGLLDRKEAHLPRARIQSVRITASVLRRPLGLASMRVDSAGGGRGGQDRRVSVPVLPASELDRVLALMLPGASPMPTLRRPPLAARRRSVIRHVVPVGCAVGVLAVVAPTVGLAAVLALPLAVGAGVAAYRGLGHAVAGGYLVTRSGWLNRRWVVVPLNRIQSARLQASPLQRRAGLVTLSVDLAGPGQVPQVREEAQVVGEELLALTVRS